MKIKLKPINVRVDPNDVETLHKNGVNVSKLIRLTLKREAAKVAV